MDQYKKKDINHPEQMHKKKKKRRIWAAVAVVILGACVMVWKSGVVKNTGVLENFQGNRVAADGEGVLDPSEALRQAESYAQIEKLRENYQKRNTAKTAVRVEKSDSAAGGELGFTGTNPREDGVAEGDHILTDGTYIYFLGAYADKVSIIEPDIDTGSMTVISEIAVGKEESGRQEMYLCGDTLVLVYADMEYERGKNYTFGVDYTFAVTYDISDRSKPVKKGEVKVSGDFETSRVVDGYLYLFASSPGSMQGESSGDLDGWEAAQDQYCSVPTVQGERLKPKQIYISYKDYAYQCLVGVSVSLQEPDQVVDCFGVMTDDDSFYISGEHIYLMEYLGWVDKMEKEATLIHSFRYQNGKMEPAAGAVVQGSVHDSFCVDEYDGYLRMVMTVAGGVLFAASQRRNWMKGRLTVIFMCWMRNCEWWEGWKGLRQGSRLARQDLWVRRHIL